MRLSRRCDARTLVAVMLAARVVSAQPALTPEAQAHLDAFLEAYQKKDYVTALRELDLGYAADPKPLFLYSKAQTLRLANRCEEAIVEYKKYLESPLSTEQQAAARTGIATCDKILAERKPEPEPKPEAPTPSPAKPEPKPVVAEAPAAAPVILEPRTDAGPRPWYLDPVGGALVGGGLVGIGVGVVFVRKSSSSYDAADAADGRVEFLEHVDTAKSQRRIGLASVSIGSALVIGGVVAYVLRRPKSEPRITAGTDGRHLFVTGTF